MKRALIILFSFFVFHLYGQQDTTFYDNNWGIVSSLNKAEYYKIVQTLDSDTIKTTYYKSGIMKSKSFSLKYQEWYESGTLKTDIDLNNKKYNGKLLTFWENGVPKRIDTYKENKFIEGKCFDNLGNEIEYFDYRIPAQFPGGEANLVKYVSKKLRYPIAAINKGIEGRVIVKFVINKKGIPTRIQIEKSVSHELDKEAMRVIKSMPKWKPGKVDGEIVDVWYTLPFVFILPY
jgi:TonB family C-terminal domain